MRHVSIEVPEDVVLATGQSPEEFAREARLLLALKLFEQGRLGSGKASQLCGLGRVDFLLAAGRLGIPAADLDEEGLERRSTASEEGPVVTDSGPLLGLAAAGQLRLLGALFGPVLVPAAVFQEVAGAGLGRPGANELRRAPWAVVTAASPLPDPLLTNELGPGDAQAIALAQSRGARLLLLDEPRARRIAEAVSGLRIEGAAGVLLEAKRRGLVPAVRPSVEAMGAHGYRLSERLIRGLVRAAGE